MASMRNIFIVGFIIFFSTTVSAENYKIAGEISYSNSPPVQSQDIEIECAEFEYDCHTFEGISSETDEYGNYEIVIEVDDSYDGAELILTILGESFIHNINLSESRSSITNTVTIDLVLEQKSPPAPVFTGFGCASIIFILAFFRLLLRSPRYRVENQKINRNLKIITCPVCKGRLEEHLLIRHLIVEHEFSPSDAAEYANSKSFDSEE